MFNASKSDFSLYSSVDWKPRKLQMIVSEKYLWLNSWILGHKTLLLDERTSTYLHLADFYGRKRSKGTDAPKDSSSEIQNPPLRTKG